MDTYSSAYNGSQSIGLKLFRQLAAEDAPPPWDALADLAPHLGSQIEQALEAVMARPQLDLRTRELATVCVLAALGGCEPQLEFHIGGALRAGASSEEVVEAIAQVYMYAGFPRALNALQVARQVLDSTRPRDR